MKRPVTLVGVLVCSALIAGQVGETTRFASKKGDFSIENIAKEFFEGSAGTVEFEFSGTPLRGKSTAQSLAFEALTAKGTAKSASDKSMYLSVATLSGDVRLWHNRGKSEERLLTTKSLTLTEAQDHSSATVTLPGSFQVVSKSGDDDISAGAGKIVFAGKSGSERVMRSATLSGAVQVSASTENGAHKLKSSSVVIEQVSTGTRFTFPSDLDTSHRLTGQGTRTVTFKAQSGWVTTPDIMKRSPFHGRPVTGAELRGPVTIKIVSVSAKEKEPMTITATGDNMTLDSNGVLILRGNITVESDDMSYTRSGTSQELYVNFGPDMEVLKYGSRGAPAKVEIKPKGGGG